MRQAATERNETPPNVEKHGSAEGSQAHDCNVSAGENSQFSETPGSTMAGGQSNDFRARVGRERIETSGLRGSGSGGIRGTIEKGDHHASQATLQLVANLLPLAP